MGGAGSGMGMPKMGVEKNHLQCLLELCTATLPKVGVDGAKKMF